MVLFFVVFLPQHYSKYIIFQMFENSLLGRLPLRCPEHQKSILTHICTEPKCEGWPLFCEECRSSYRYKQRHYGHELSVIELSRGIQEICVRVDREKKAASAIFGEMMGAKGVEGLLKWQEEKEQHFNSIQNHINTIKFQVEEEISNIVMKFQQELTQEKTKLYQQLENYYNNYKEKFDKFSRLTEPIVAMQNKFKFYSTPNTLFFKICSETGQPKLGVWLSDLKRTLSLTEKATNMPQQYAQQIKKYGQLANDIMDDLPRIRNVDYEREMPAAMAGAARDVLRSLVKLKEHRSFLNRSNSAQIPSENWKHSLDLK